MNEDVESRYQLSSLQSQHEVSGPQFFEFEWTQISDNGHSLKHPGERRLCVLADHPILAGLSRYYYEVKVSEFLTEEESSDEPEPHTILTLGFCTSSTHSLGFPGWVNEAPSSQSWAYYGDDGENFHVGKIEGKGEC